MRFKALEIQGFKSFPDKTRLTFGEGITAVVGPNGSGKSNISDAVRWVLGEQSTRTLRGSKMEDVIFGGTKSRKAQGVCSVSLTMDNSGGFFDLESPEVTITRKLYRSGESEYRINGNLVRLKDITELFMDTGLGRDGYSMIGQGRIAEIVSAKSNQRRELFEEAAGISKFRYRKGEAEKRLEQAQENLLRLKDILLELENRVEPLRVQSEKAGEFLRLSEEKKLLEISLWMKQLEQIKARLREQEDRLLETRGGLQQAEEQLEELEQKIAAAFEEMTRCGVQLEEGRAKIHETEEKSAENLSNQAVLENELRHLEQEKERIAIQFAEAGLSDDQLTEKEGELARELAELEAKRLELEEQFCLTGERLAEGRAEEKALLEQNGELTAKKQGLAAAQNEAKIQSVTSRSLLAEGALRQKDLEQQLEQLGQTREQALQELAQERELEAQIEQKLTQMDNRQSGYKMLLDSREKTAEQCRREVAGLEEAIRMDEQKARLYTDMERSHEGFYNSVRYLLRQAAGGMLRGVIGAVSDLIRVEPEYTLAVETACGPAIQHIVVEDEQAAKQAISLLKRENQGRATFLPLTSVRGTRLEQQGLSSCEGFVAIASDLVDCEGRFQGIVHSILGRTVVARDLDCAVPIAKRFSYRFRIVTLDGQVINAGGSFTGGSSGKTGGLLSRKNEISQLQSKIARSQEELTGAKERAAEAASQRDKMLREMKLLEEEVRMVQQDQIRCQGEQKRLALSLEEQEKQCRLTEKSLQELSGRLEQLSKEQDGAGELVERLGREMAQFEQEAGRLERRIAEAQEKTAAFTQQSHGLEMEQAALQGSKKALEERKDQYERQRQDQKARMEQLEEQNKQLAVRRHEMESRQQDLTEEKQRLTERLSQLQKQGEQLSRLRMEREKEVSGLRNEERQLSSQREGVAQQLARAEERQRSVQEEYDRIISGLWDEYQLTRTEAEEFARPVENVVLAQGQVSELKNKIRGLGTVNLSAIEEYREVFQRYNFLKGQLEDVERSREELRKLIAQLTGSMEQTFGENFKRIAQEFSNIFVDLFGGGRASLTLTDPDNLLESGIDIFVEPPGKVIKNLGLLSGGEQAFVAIAIYFAILRVRPAPFCLLDEIEAALDDVNVGRFAQYLRRLSGETQFIAITHRRGTMEEADMLYGVTMQEEGVSKLLELNVTEAEQRLLQSQEERKDAKNGVLSKN